MSRSTFSVLFYVNKSKVKNGIVPVMGRITINGTQSQFSCKRSIPLSLWDAKGNCAKGRTREALDLNRDLDNIKAQIIKHYQHLSDREAFVTAEMVRNAYQGFGSEYESINCHFLLHTNMKNISLSNFSSIPIPQFISAVDPNIIVISCNLHNSDTLTGCSLEVWIKNTTC